MTPALDLTSFSPLLVAQHMGRLHAYEQWLVAFIAFAPFVVLGVVIVVQRRRAIEEEVAEAADANEAVNAFSRTGETADATAVSDAGLNETVGNDEASRS